MGLAETYHREHKERLKRMGGATSKIKVPIVEAPEQKETIPVKKYGAIEPATLAEWIRRQEQIPLPTDAVFSIISESLPPTIHQISRAVASHFGITLEELVSDRRTNHIVYARHIAFWFCKKLTARSFPAIGKHFGDRDHTTVLHGVAKIDLMLRHNEMAVADIEAIKIRMGWKLP